MLFTEAILVYGFNMGNYENYINTQYLKTEFPDISVCTHLTFGNYIFNQAIYGIPCAFDKTTGQISISDKKRKL